MTGWRREHHILMKHLSNNEYALAFFNMAEEDGSIPVHTYSIGLPATGYAIQLRDIFTGEDVGTFHDFFETEVKAHDVKLYRMKIVKD